MENHVPYVKFQEDKGSFLIDYSTMKKVARIHGLRSKKVRHVKKRFKKVITKLLRQELEKI